jgi:hypothetical protein
MAKTTFTLKELRQKQDSGTTPQRTFTLDELKGKQDVASQMKTSRIENEEDKKSGILSRGLGTAIRSTTGVLTGVAKGAAETLQTIGQTALAVPALAPGGKTFGERREEIKEETGIAPETLEAKGQAEKIGKFGERIAEFAAPVSKVATAVKGLNFFTQLAARSATAGAVATAQTGEIGKDTAIAASIEAILPGANKLIIKPIASIIKRLTKGLASGLSGVSTDAIETIIKNPNKAKEVVTQLEKSGNFAVLEKNAKTIVDGVSKVRQDARKAFGEGLEQLKEADITPKTFRDSVGGFLDSVGSTIKNKVRGLTNVEFSDPKNIKKASDLIDELQTTKLDGFSLRKLLKKIGDSKFKTATTDERLSFNAFIKDFEKSVNDAVINSTDKLDDINRAFSADMQLAEGMEQIFSKIKFKSSKEINAVSQKLENLFSQKGLSPRNVDDFLNKIGIDPADFKTSEATRQITAGRTEGGNLEGVSFAEFTRKLTSAVLTPETVRDAAILSGKTEPIIKTILEAVAPASRGALIELLINEES